MKLYDLSQYDGVLAYGEVIRELYVKKGWAQRTWTWHEAADTSLFYPREGVQKEGDVVWIGNWGDNERASEIYEYFINPVKKLKLRATVYGVRYPKEVIDSLNEAGITYGNWLPNYEVPAVLAKFKLTVHIPRKPYTAMLPGIPTIRPFEAMACGIPLISAPWNDTESLFHTKDFMFVRNGAEMEEAMARFLEDEALANSFAQHALETIKSKHTCKHRVEELLGIVSLLQSNSAIESDVNTLIEN